MRGFAISAGAVLLLLAVPMPAEALAPDEILILVRRADMQAPPIARLYCEQRDVPRENIIPLDLPAGDSIPWSVYQSKVVEPLRLAISKRKQPGRIRCLLLVGSMPLRIEADPATPAEKNELQQLNDSVKRLGLEIYQNGWRLDQLGLGQSPGKPPDEVASRLKNTWEIEVYYHESVKRANEVVSKLPPEKKALVAELARIRSTVEGQFSQIDPEPRDSQSPDWGKRHGEWAKARDEKLKPTLDKLAESESQRVGSLARDDRRREVLKVRGKIGQLHQIYDDQNELSNSGRDSALDNELVLLWRDGYKLNGPLSNPLANVLYDKYEGDKPPPMVARLDGYDRAQPIRQIEDAIAVEKAGLGLVGKFCIDIQGLPTTDPSRYDDNLILDLENWKTRPATLPLVKEASIVTMAASEANPIAVYVGWGGFDRYPGGYACAHGGIAVCCNPVAAKELHDPKSKQWANGFLSAGAAVVIANVLNNDPRTMIDFRAFAKYLLADGLPLAEAYWRSCRSASWRTILIGDPLYTPSKKKPATQPAGKGQ